MLVLAFGLTHGGGNQDHTGVGLEPFMVDQADLLVVGLLAFHAKLDPGILGGLPGCGRGRRCGGGSWRLLLRRLSRLGLGLLRQSNRHHHG